MSNLNTNTAIVARTKSLINGKPILVLATGFNKCSNDKLGSNAIQTFYLSLETYPSNAVNTGADRSVCGDCPLRKQANNVCYVGTHILNNMHKAYLNGSYAELNDEHLAQISVQQKLLRLGGYGDPTSVIPFTTSKLAQFASATVGYTHQWRHRFAQPYRGLLQASVETKTDAVRAHYLGWKTFRVAPKEDLSLLPSETICPNHENPEIKCQECRLCDGKSANIVNPVHNGAAKETRFSDWLAKFKEPEDVFNQGEYRTLIADI